MYPRDGLGEAGIVGKNIEVADGLIEKRRDDEMIAGKRY